MNGRDGTLNELLQREAEEWRREREEFQEQQLITKQNDNESIEQHGISKSSE